ncbi:MAG: tRNA (adenosine(37)-N6)-dimethylallyltransferase MiaA [Ignavibacteriales bacterium]|nr:tRNA (adenosine(37)-N6)-dimethylallyltransferase MiaA [Ignavibacteriales bacterium]
MNKSKKVIVILGPTAVGKTKFAVDLAYKFSGEIISADSRQVYIGMDIGTGKDLSDYKFQNSTIKHHLIDVVKPECEFNLYLFQNLFYQSLKDICEDKKLPILVGGTGLYLSSVIQKYSITKVDFNSERSKVLNNYSNEKLVEILLDTNPKLHNSTDLKDKNRIINAILIAETNEQSEIPDENIEFLIIGIFEDREIHKKMIRERLKLRLKSGMIEEVQNLLSIGISHDKLRFFGLEYKFVSQYLTGELNYNDMYQKLASAIIQFSKRQMTWFRKMEKEGIIINWMNSTDLIKAQSLISEFIK